MERTWKSSDVIEIDFPMPPRITTGFNEFIYIECGPLLFSKPIVDSWVKLCDRGMTADWQVFPASS